MVKDIKEWWEANSKIYQKEHNVPIDISYGPGILNEDKLKLLGDIKGKNILEIGCGGAQCGVAMALRGAKVTGVDLSEEQLKLARKLSKDYNVKIKLYQGDISNLEQIASNSQDIVFSSWALLYVGDLPRCYREVNRVLRENGLFVFSLDHPFWRTLNKKEMKVKVNYLEMAGQRYEEQYKKGTFVAYRHTISEIANALIDTGFSIERVLEPDPRKKDKTIPSETTQEAYKRKAMCIVPRTIIFKARKS